MINRFIQISSQKGPEKAYSPEIGFSSTLNLLDAQIQKEILKYGKLFRFGPEFFEKIRNKDLQISYLKSKEFQHVLKQKVNVFINNMMIKQFIEKASPESALLHRFVNSQKVIYDTPESTSSMAQKFLVYVDSTGNNH
jgi:hypothetical protein